jgi:hypothetical protein
MADLSVQWQEFTLAKPPGKAGIYAIKCGDRWLYIGKAAEITPRIKKSNHPVRITADLPGLSYWWISSGADRDWLEQALIQRHQPEWNGGTSWNGISQWPQCNRDWTADVAESDALAALALIGG